MLLSRFGLPPMVGFLVAGFVYNMAGLEAPTGLQLVADLGVTLLLFSIGLKLDLHGLAKAEIWGTSLAHLVLSTMFFSGVIWLGQQLFSIALFELSITNGGVFAFVNGQKSNCKYVLHHQHADGDFAAQGCHLALVFEHLHRKHRARKRKCKTQKYDRFVGTQHSFAAVASRAKSHLQASGWGRTRLTVGAKWLVFFAGGGL